jgi:hypothetical protein
MEHGMGTIGEVVRVRVIPVPDRGPGPELDAEPAGEPAAEETSPTVPAPVLAATPR